MCRFLFAYSRRTLFCVVCSLFQQATSWLPNTLLVFSLAYGFSLRLVVSSTAFCWARFTSLAWWAWFSVSGTEPVLPR